MCTFFQIKKSTIVIMIEEVEVTVISMGNVQFWTDVCEKLELSVKVACISIGRPEVIRTDGHMTVIIDTTSPFLLITTPLKKAYEVHQPDLFRYKPKTMPENLYNMRVLPP